MSQSPEFLARANHLRSVASAQVPPIEKTRRIFLEEPSFSTLQKRNSEFAIKSRIAEIFDVPYSSVRFCGSAHLGISTAKGTTFELGVSDLDIAIVSASAFSGAFEQLAKSTRGFDDVSSYGPHEQSKVEQIKKRIWQRGFILVSDIRASDWARSKTDELRELSQKHRNMFSKITAAIYLSEYFYCWKQKSAIDGLLAIEA